MTDNVGRIAGSDASCGTSSVEASSMTATVRVGFTSQDLWEGHLQLCRGYRCQSTAPMLEPSVLAANLHCV